MLTLTIIEDDSSNFAEKIKTHKYTAYGFYFLFKYNINIEFTVIHE